MRIGVTSDLHADISSQPPIVLPECDALVVAGDCANSLGATEKLLSRFSRRSEIPLILTVDGNHEHYSNAPQGRTVAQTMRRLDELSPPRCVYLPANPPVRLAPHLYAVGRCGWYSFDLHDEPLESAARRWVDMMNDDKWIGFSTMDQPQPWEWADQHEQELRSAMKWILEGEPEARFVVVTHTVPHGELLHKHPKFQATNPFYVNCHMESLAKDFGDRIVLWVYGHTHFRGEREIDGVRYLANPRGYPGENPTWEPVVVEI